jgi:hypothetical protein
MIKRKPMNVSTKSYMGQKIFKTSKAIVLHLWTQGILKSFLTGKNV